MCCLSLELSGQPGPCVVKMPGMERQGRENRRHVWEGMKGFHDNLCLPVTKVALQIPQASFPWTLKPASLAAESPALERRGCIRFGRGEGEKVEARLFCWNQNAGPQVALETPLYPFCRLLTPSSR